MLLVILIGVPMGIMQVYCFAYYVSALDKNSTMQWKLTRLQVGLINGIAVVAYLVCFAIFDRDSLIAAATALCGSIMIFTLYKFTRGINNDKNEGN